MKALLLSITLLLLSLTACTSDIYIKRCTSQGGEWSEWYGCNHTQTGQHIYTGDFPHDRGPFDALAAGMVLQGMQTPSRPPLAPVPIQPLAHTCFNTVAGNQIISQCY